MALNRDLPTKGWIGTVRWRTDGRCAPTHDRSMVGESKANQYRALAEECERLAAAVKTEKERDELLRKAKGYRRLAENEERLGGDADPKKPKPN